MESRAQQPHVGTSQLLCTACVACRRSKVKCNRGLDDAECSRCARLSLECVVARAQYGKPSMKRSLAQMRSETRALLRDQTSHLLDQVSVPPVIDLLPAGWRKTALRKALQCGEHTALPMLRCWREIALAHDFVLLMGFVLAACECARVPMRDVLFMRSQPCVVEANEQAVVQDAASSAAPFVSSSAPLMAPVIEARLSKSRGLCLVKMAHSGCLSTHTNHAFDACLGWSLLCVDSHDTDKCSLDAVLHEEDATVAHAMVGELWGQLATATADAPACVVASHLVRLVHQSSSTSGSHDCAAPSHSRHGALSMGAPPSYAAPLPLSFETGAGSASRLTDIGRVDDRKYIWCRLQGALHVETQGMAAGASCLLYELEPVGSEAGGAGGSGDGTGRDATAWLHLEQHSWSGKRWLGVDGWQAAAEAEAEAEATAEATAEAEARAEVEGRAEAGDREEADAKAGSEEEVNGTVAMLLTDFLDELDPETSHSLDVFSSSVLSGDAGDAVLQ